MIYSQGWNQTPNILSDVYKLSDRIYQRRKEVFLSRSCFGWPGVCKKILDELVRDSVEYQGPY